MAKKKLLIITSGLKKAGAEKILSFLALNIGPEYQVTILAFSGGFYEEEIKGHNIEVRILFWKDIGKAPSFFLKLLSEIREIKPDIIQTWMYKADLLGGLAAYILGYREIFWGVRHGQPSLLKEKLSSSFLILLCGLFSWFIPKKILCCSAKGGQHHKRYLFDKNKFIYVPNFVEEFPPRVDGRKGGGLRKMIGLENDVFLVGLVARFHNQKGHKLLLNASKILKKKNKSFHIVFIGDGIEESYGRKIQKFVERKQLKDRVSIMKQVEDIEPVLVDLDLLCMCSTFGEGFPNIVAESIMCQTPVIVTLVGDADKLVKNRSWHVEKKSPRHLAEKIQMMMEFNASELEKLVLLEKRMLSVEFTKEKFIKNFHTVYENS